MKPPRLTIHGWDIPDWRLSRAYREMTPLCRGLYRELCDSCYLDGWIPDDPTLCAPLAGCSTEAMKRNWEQLRAFFRRAKHQGKQDGSTGRLEHFVVTSVRSHAMISYQKRVDAGKKGGRPSTNKNNYLESNGLVTRKQSESKAKAVGLGRVGFTILQGEESIHTQSSNPERSTGYAPNGYDPTPGWQKLLALWPANGRMNTNLAAQYWVDRVTSLEAETAWLAAVARYAGSDQVKRGVIMALPKFLASDRTQDTWPESEETAAQRRKNELREYERSNKL